MDKVIRHSKRTVIGLVGGVVLLAGVIMIPYPGPGWLVVFMGLAILATEFLFAQKLLEYGRRRYDAWVEWLKCQHVAVRILVLAFTGAVVVTTIWLLNGFGIIRLIATPVLGLDEEWGWVDSPWF